MADFGLHKGNVSLESVSSLTFGPADILFIADSRRATIVAVDVAETGPDGSAQSFDLQDLDAKLASYLGCGISDVHIADLAIHPRTENVYLSVTRGAGRTAVPLIIRVDRRDGSISDVSLENVQFAEVVLDDSPALDDERLDIVVAQGQEGELVKYGDREFRLVRSPIRAAAITDMQYVDGTLFVAGLSNEEFASTLRRIRFPFTSEPEANSLEIFHVSHGAWETAAPIRTFAAYADGASIIASYTCTPLVTFSVPDLRPGTHVKGRTVAELGSVNTPLDIVAFMQGADEHLLVSNSNRPLMKIACSDIAQQDALTEPHFPEGVPRQEPDYMGIGRMGALNDDYILAIQIGDDGRRHLRSLSTASL